MDKLKPELLDQLRKTMRLKRYSFKTDKSGVCLFICFFYHRISAFRQEEGVLQGTRTKSGIN